MIRIAIVEDEKTIRDAVLKKIKMSIPETVRVQIDVFSSAEEMLEGITPEKKYHIVFSDIEMTGLNGIELGVRLREMWTNFYLIYLTSHSEFALKSYRVEAYQYVLKEEMDELVPMILGRLLQKIQREKNKYIVVSNSLGQKKLHYADIVCIRKSKGSKYVEYITINDCYRERTSLGTVIERLDAPEFLEVERGSIVNMRHIEAIKENIILLANNMEVVVSRLRLSKVKESINHYWREL